MNVENVSTKGMQTLTVTRIKIFLMQSANTVTFSTKQFIMQLVSGKESNKELKIIDEYYRTRCLIILFCFSY